MESSNQCVNSKGCLKHLMLVLKMIIRVENKQLTIVCIRSFSPYFQFHQIWEEELRTLRLWLQLWSLIVSFYVPQLRTSLNCRWYFTKTSIHHNMMIISYLEVLLLFWWACFLFGDVLYFYQIHLDLTFKKMASRGPRAALSTNCPEFWDQIKGWKCIALFCIRVRCFGWSWTPGMEPLGFVFFGQF